MEAELIKENMQSSYPSANLVLSIVAEGESIVPDINKDIAEIILVEGRSFIEKTEIQKNRILFTGIAEFTVLYTADDSGTINSITSKIPFNHIEECSGINPDDKYLLSYETVHSECILLNSRKISLKSVISTRFTSYSDITIPVVTNVRSSESEVQKTTASFSRLAAATEEVFTVSDFLELPSSSEPIDSPLLTRVSLKDCSFKTVTGKAVVKGTLMVFRLYLSPEGAISHILNELPFTEILDIPSLSEDDICDVSFAVKSYSTDDTSEDSSRPGYAFSADIILSAAFFTTEKLPVITDSYIPGMEVSVTYNTYKKCELLKNERLSLTLKENIALPSDMPPIDQLYPVRARISDIKAATDNGKLSITGTADILVVYLSSDSSIKSFTHEFTFTEIIDAPSENTDIFVNAKITHADYNFINQTKLDLRCNAEIDIKLCCNTDSFRVIDNIQLGDVIPKKRPSVIIYFVKSGDTLWDIAKKYSITAEKIMAANAMENGDILNAGVRLLIPA